MSLFFTSEQVLLPICDKKWAQPQRQPIEHVMMLQRLARTLGIYYLRVVIRNVIVVAIIG